MKFNIVRSLNGKLNYQSFIENNAKYAPNIVQKLSVPISSRLKNTVKVIDDTLGVSKVSDAQNLVSQHERSFLKARNSVHLIKQNISEQQELLNNMRTKLDRCDRHDEKYLSLVADEHKLLLNTKRLQREFDTAEERERRIFAEYSGSVRLSHEKERARAERTKYWSIIGSIAGTMLGFMCSSLVTRERLKHMKDITQTSITQAVNKVHRDIEDQHFTLIQNVQSLKEAVMQQDAVPQSDIKTSNDIKFDKALDMKINEMHKKITLLDDSIKGLPAINEKYLCKFTEKLLDCVPKDKRIHELRREFMEHLKLYKQESVDSLVNLSENVNIKIDETLNSIESKSIEVVERRLENVNIVSSSGDEVNENINKELQLTLNDITDNYVSRKNVNIFIGISTLALVALSSWNDLF